MFYYIFILLFYDTINCYPKSTTCTTSYIVTDSSIIFVDNII